MRDLRLLLKTLLTQITGQPGPFSKIWASPLRVPQHHADSRLNISAIRLCQLVQTSGLHLTQAQVDLLLHGILSETHENLPFPFKVIIMRELLSARPEEVLYKCILKLQNFVIACLALP